MILRSYGKYNQAVHLKYLSMYSMWVRLWILDNKMAATTIFYVEIW